MSAPALEIRDLDFSYDRRPVLTSINVEIAAGKFVAFIGPNGGGKTTLFKLILGFLKPDAGLIRVLGLPPQDARAHVAYVPQGLRYDKQFPISTLELVLTGRLRHAPWHGRYQAEDKKAALEALSRVGLEDRANVPFSRLSGGQAQRALIARALASHPDLLLLDEPTASVDARAEAEIYALLRELKGSTTILLVTHDLTVATSIVDEIFCVQHRVDRLEKAQVCDHFAMGIFHPIIPKEPKP